MPDVERARPVGQLAAALPSVLLGFRVYLYPPQGSKTLDQHLEGPVTVVCILLLVLAGLLGFMQGLGFRAEGLGFWPKPYTPYFKPNTRNPGCREGPIGLWAADH